MHVFLLLSNWKHLKFHSFWLCCQIMSRITPFFGPILCRESRCLGDTFQPYKKWWVTQNFFYRVWGWPQKNFPLSEVRRHFVIQLYYTMSSWSKSGTFFGGHRSPCICHLIYLMYYQIFSGYYQTNIWCYHIISGYQKSLFCDFSKSINANKTRPTMGWWQLKSIQRAIFLELRTP